MSLKPLEQEGVHITWKPWKLPINAITPPKPEGYMDGVKRFLEKIVNETELVINPPSQKYDTYLAHVGMKYAESKGKSQEYNQSVFKAVWEHNENIETIEVLSGIANQIGLDSIEFREAILNQSFKNEVDRDFKEAEELNIWTIPSYIGDHGEIQVHHFDDMPTLSEIKKII